MSESPLQLGATFIPGGADDYHISQQPADVVLRVPQRAAYEVSERLQDGIASPDWNREIDGYGAAQRNVKQHPNGNQSNNQSAREARNSSNSPGNEELIAYSYFPKLRTRTTNVPPSHEEKLRVLEAARLPVLHSPNPEMQLSWAQDALSYSDTCIEEARRSGSREKTATSQYAIRKIEEQIQTDAINIVKHLADQYHPRADFMKGMWLEFGKFGMMEDKPEAFRCYKRSAAKGYFRAEYRMGMQYEFTGEYVKALQHYKIGETLDDAASCYRMGMMSLLGQLGQPQDFATAVRLIRRAADSADENAPQGAYVYGMLLAMELPQITVPEIYLSPDLGSALRYIERSAYLGFSKAQLKMGSAYELCSLGCEFDPTLSLHYNLLAARQGEAEAEMSISKWFLCGYQGLFLKNEELAFSYAQRAAATGLVTAQFAMGYFYEVGVHVGHNLKQAFEWYEKAARSGNVDARGRILNLSKSRTLTKIDHEDVAISRIRSRHGSRRGNRPEHLTKPTTPMPKIPDEYLQGSRTPRTDAPGSLNNPVTRISPTQQSSATITPYPLDDAPPFVAPYPIEDDISRVERRNDPIGGLLNLNVDQESLSALVDSRQDTSATRIPTVPLSKSPLSRVLGGNVHNNHENSALPSNLRGPLGANGGKPLPQLNNLSLSDNYNTQEPVGKFTSEIPSPVEKLDIGFSAPIDPQADQFNRSNAVSDSERRRAGAAIASSGKSKVPAKLVKRNVISKNMNLLIAQPLPNPSPSAAGGNIDFSEAGVPRFSFQSFHSFRPPVPAKGPQTFEEMGVPPGKDEHDCIIM